MFNIPVIFRLSRTRRIIENVYGILTARWRVLRRTLLASRTTAKAIIQATVVLHNFMLLHTAEVYAPGDFVDREDRHGRVLPGRWRQDAEADVLQPLVRQLPPGAPANREAGEVVREEFVDYFLTEGSASVPWQWRHLRRL